MKNDNIFFTKTTEIGAKNEPIKKFVTGGKSGEQLYKIGATVTYKTSKGNEIGEVLSFKFLPTRKSYMYQIKNPRGGTYGIFESNIVGSTDNALFNVGQTVIIKGKDRKYLIKNIINDPEITYEVQDLFNGGTAYLPEKALELVLEDKTPKPKFNVGQTVQIEGRPEKYLITEIIPKENDKLQMYETKYIETGDLFPLYEDELELAIEDKQPDPENELNFKLGDIFRRNMEGEEPPNTKIIYQIESIGNANCSVKVTNLKANTSRGVNKLISKIQEEIETGWWIKYDTQVVPENKELFSAIEELKETNSGLWELYIDSENVELKKELRESCNDNNLAIKDFSADLYFNPEKFLNEYFEKATKKIDYDNTPLSDAEFDKIVQSKEFLNWFGDFNKGVTDISPALSSKVITNKFIKGSTGKVIPQIVYHGTWNKTHFSRFKFKKFPVCYFATNKSYAEWFSQLGSGILYECFLDIKFVCDFRPLGLTEYTWNEIADYLRADYGIELPKNSSTNKQKVWAWIRGDAPNFTLINSIKDFGFTGIAHIENNPSDKLPTGEDNTTTAYMIFNPEQAKLVRYVSSGNAFTDIFFMKKGGKVGNALLQRIKNLRI